MPPHKFKRINFILLNKKILLTTKLIFAVTYYCTRNHGKTWIFEFCRLRKSFKLRNKPKIALTYCVLNLYMDVECC